MKVQTGCNACGRALGAHRFSSGGRQVVCLPCARAWMATYLRERGGLSDTELASELALFDAQYSDGVTA